MRPSPACVDASCASAARPLPPTSRRRSSTPGGGCSGPRSRPTPGRLQERADVEAIRVFAENLRHLLLQPPLGGKRVLAIDPGFSTGCKVVALDEQGNLVEETVIYPHEPQKRAAEAKQALAALASRHRSEAIAVGNGTAGRETHEFVRAMKGEGLLAEACVVVLVN